jgi:ribosomal protein L18E
MNITSAKKAEEFVYVAKRDNNQKIKVALVPGHKGKMYQVRINRTNRGMLSQCKCKDADCPGNKNTICYHVLATLLASAQRSRPKIKLSFCEKKIDAQKLINIAGTMFPLKSKQSGKQIWVVAVQNAKPSDLI